MKSAASIVSEASEGVEGLVNVGELRPDYVARVINRYRQELRPDEPVDMDSEFGENVIPHDLYRREVKVEDRRHLIFATDNQLDVISQARRWYIDGTFKVMRAPFTMLLSIHAFVRRGDCSKQVPLIFVAMSGRSSQDYEKVLRAIRRGLQDNQVVEEIVCDFEKALWKAIRLCFPTTLTKGCSFHLGQLVWRQVQALGWPRSTSRIAVRTPQSACCLPALSTREHIEDVFSSLEDLNTSDQLEPLFLYIRRTWLQSTVWTVENWSVFGESVRTNNDCEGWHRRLNTRAGVSPPFDTLVRHLHKEALEVEAQIRLVSELKLRRLQRATYRSMQSKIFSAWDRYRSKELSATALLKLVSTMYRPKLGRREAEAEEDDE